MHILFSNSIFVLLASFKLDCYDIIQQKVNTCYVATVSCRSILHHDNSNNNNKMLTWNIDKRYHQFKELAQKIKHYSKISTKVLLPVMRKGRGMIIESSSSTTDTHLIDEIRIERVTILSNWMHDLVSDSKLMTITEVVKALFEFLDFENLIQHSSLSKLD